MHYAHLVLTGAADVRRMRQDEWDLLSSQIVLDVVECHAGTMPRKRQLTESFSPCANLSLRLQRA